MPKPPRVPKHQLRIVRDLERLEGPRTPPGMETWPTHLAEMERGQKELATLTTRAHAASHPPQQPSWWGRRSTGQKIAIGAGGTAVATGGLVALHRRHVEKASPYERRLMAQAVGAAAIGGVGGEVGGRKLGERRYRSGKGRPNVMLRYGSYDRGWKNAQRRDVGKAVYSAEGTNVVRLTARRPTGQFVSHENDLDVFHVTPKRNPTSRVLVARKGGDAASKPWVTKGMGGVKNEYALTHDVARRLASERRVGQLSQFRGRVTGVGRKTMETSERLTDAKKRGTGVGKKLSA